MLKGFREFILRGNVIDLAVAVVIGAAFTAIVTGLVTGIFNPLIALVVLNSMSIHAAGVADNFLLAEAARVVGGKWFSYAISLDAFIVLWGAVLTSFVGVSGLMHRMAGEDADLEIISA